MTTEPQVSVSTAETVNVQSHDLFAHPAIIWLVAFVTVGVLIGFGVVTFFVLRADVAGIDPATKGALIQTWNNLAVAAAAVWTTSRAVDRLKGVKQ